MITPEKFIQSVKFYKTGDGDFCRLASVSTECDGIPVNDNAGFWFEVIENGERLVLSVQMDSLASDEPVQAVSICEDAQLREFMENARQWASNALK